MQRDLVHPQLRAEGRSHTFEILVHERLIDHDLSLSTIASPNMRALLLSRGRAVQAGGDQDGDIRLRIAAADLLQQQRQRQLAGYSAGMVARNQYDPVLALCQLRTAGGCADRVGERLPNQLWLPLCPAS